MQTSVGWDADPALPAWPGLPRLEAAVTADACVVGLGGSGLAAVDELVSRGLSVVGLDAGRVASGAAGRNGGFLLAGGALSMPDACEAWGTEAAVELHRRTLAELDRLADQLGRDVVRRTGSLRVAGLPGTPRDEAEAADRELELADCRQQAEVLASLGLPVEPYDGPLGQGLFLPDDAAMNPARRALGLAAQLAPYSSLFEHSPVTALAPGLVTTSHGSVSAGIVVVAVDGRLDVLLPQLSPLVRTARLQMLATTPGLPARLPCPVYGRWGYDYAQQDEAGRLLVGGGRDQAEDEEWTHDTCPTGPVQAWVEDVAARMAGGPVQVAHRWGASVGYTPDGRALCLAADDGVVACGGYSGVGNLVGPVAARAAVALAVDGTPPPSCFTSAMAS